jgi:hypothetical protein
MPSRWQYSASGAHRSNRRCHGRVGAAPETPEWWGSLRSPPPYMQGSHALRPAVRCRQPPGAPRRPHRVSFPRARRCLRPGILLRLMVAARETASDSRRYFPDHRARPGGLACDRVHFSGLELQRCGDDTPASRRRFSNASRIRVDAFSPERHEVTPDFSQLIERIGPDWKPCVL